MDGVLAGLPLAAINQAFVMNFVIKKRKFFAKQTSRPKLNALAARGSQPSHPYQPASHTSSDVPRHRP